MTMLRLRDASTLVDPRLSRILEAVVNDPARSRPPTLSDVRAVLVAGGVQWSEEGEISYPQDRTSLCIGLDDLINRYGEDASAGEFINAKASEDLARVIETAMNDSSDPHKPTLRALRDGMVTRLVGQGGIEGDRDDALLIEIDELIARYGADAPAQTFIR